MPLHTPNPAGSLADRFSVGSMVIALLAIASTLVIAALPSRDRGTIEMWLFARPHEFAYRPIVESWNEANPDVPAELHLLGLAAMERRILSGFLSGTPVADMIETDVNVASRAFAGPMEDVGFLDLTDRLMEEGIFDEINTPSFSPWTSRGRVFGIPHDVHPVVLCYRADLVEEAGIDVEKIETWDDFIREMRPLMEDTSGDGRPDRYLLNFWEQHLEAIEALILQAGGRLFDENDQPDIVSDTNIHVMSTLTTWMVDGPTRIAIDADEFTEYGNQLRVQGRVIASLMPDWLSGVWRSDLPQLHGKLKLMPLPAWTEGGVRTSVLGGSMLGISRQSEHREEAWELAKQLYLSESAAEHLFRTNGIISPVKRMWESPVYEEREPYFSNQAIGRLFIELAPHVPQRSSSPYNKFAKISVRNSLAALRRYAIGRGLNQPEQLYDEARRQLELVEQSVRRQMERNVFMGVEPN